MESAASASVSPERVASQTSFFDEPRRVSPSSSQRSLDEQVDQLLAKLAPSLAIVADDDEVRFPKLKSGTTAATSNCGIIMDIPEGQMIGYGFVWQLFDPKVSNLLEKLEKPVLNDHVEEETLFSRPVYDENMKLSSSVEIFKVNGCPDIHLRMTDIDMVQQILPADMGHAPEQYTMEASVINEEGQPIIYGKRVRSYAFAGRRVYELLPFITAQELELNKSKLFTSDGSMLIRMTIRCADSDVTDELMEAESNKVIVMTDKDSETKNANITFDKSKQKLNASKEFGKLVMDSFKVRVKSFMGNKEYSDAVLNILQDNSDSTVLVSIPIHRMVVCAQSSVLASKLNKSSTVNLKGFSVSTVKQALGYMYDGEFGSSDYNFIDICDVIRFAEKFEVVGLKDYCIEKLFEMKDELTVTNGIQIFKLGINWKSVPLKNLAVRVFERLENQLKRSDEFKSFVNECPVPSFIKGFVRRNSD